MIYRVTKHVFNSFGKEVETSHFNVPGSFFEELIQLLMDEGYILFDNDDNYTMLSKIYTMHDKPYYSRFQFRKVNHG